jgi:exosome complex component CSL4
MPELKQPGERVLPGDPLAYSEEYLPGDGTFDDGTFLRAARLGKVEVDPNEMRVRVSPATSTPAKLQIGQYVIGTITMLKPIMAGVEVLLIEGVERNIAGDTNGTLHVSKIAKRYVQDTSREYRLGDVVRALVIGIKPSIQLTTQDPRCGAILCLCLRDRFPMKLAGKSLECEHCGFRDVRNVAPDYGKVFLPAEAVLHIPPS